jgi:ribosomal protein S18 acetylase RimI-like enzyme
MSSAASPERDRLLPQPNEFLQCARILIRNFAYVFNQFLPIYSPESQTERQAEIMVSVMQAFDGRHLLGWRGFRVIRVDGQIASIAVVSWQGSETDSRSQTVLAFVMGVAKSAPLQLPGCLRRAYAARSILRTPDSRFHEMAILYIAAEQGQAKRGRTGELLESLEAEARAESLQGILAAVRNHNTPAQSFFRKHGFTAQAENDVIAGELLYYRKEFSNDL